VKIRSKPLNFHRLGAALRNRLRSRSTHQSPAPLLRIRALHGCCRSGSEPHTAAAAPLEVGPSELRAAAQGRHARPLPPAAGHSLRASRSCLCTPDQIWGEEGCVVRRKDGVCVVCRAGWARVFFGRAVNAADRNYVFFCGLSQADGNYKSDKNVPFSCCESQI
jgi:hypothetical protein